MDEGIVEQSNLPALSGEKGNLIPSTHEMAVFQTMAKQAVASKMYRGVGDEAGIMMIMLAARELNIPPMQALNGGLNIIEGKVEISARLMSALIRRAGHSIQIKESTNERCILYGRRSDNGDTATVNYSIEDAQKAGLIREKGGWKKVPKDMCFARAMSRLARQLFSDVIGIGYVDGEISKEEYVDNSEKNRQIEIEAQVTNYDHLENFLLQFKNLEEKFKWAEYISEVMAKLNWSSEKTIEEFSKDMKKTKEKFEKWRKT